MAEVIRHINEHVNVIDVFHDVNSILHTVTNIHTKARILLKVFNLFHSDNFALFKVTSIHSVRKSTRKTKKPYKTRRKTKENARLKQSKYRETDVINKKF